MVESDQSVDGGVLQYVKSSVTYVCFRIYYLDVHHGDSLKAAEHYGRFGVAPIEPHISEFALY
jgi:hypothetical protein